MPNPRGTRAKAEKMARYIQIGGPAMTAAQAAQELGVTIDAVNHYRRELTAAGIVPPGNRGRPPAEPTTPPPPGPAQAGPVPLYRWRARRYPWALRAIAQAEAIHGTPEPVCRCGRPLPDHRAQNGGRCETCAPDLLVVPARPGQVHFTTDAAIPACHSMAADPQLTRDPRLVTCQTCERTTARLNALGAQMVDA